METSEEMKTNKRMQTNQLKIKFSDQKTTFLATTSNARDQTHRLPNESVEKGRSLRNSRAERCTHKHGGIATYRQLENREVALLDVVQHGQLFFDRGLGQRPPRDHGRNRIHQRVDSLLEHIEFDRTGETERKGDLCERATGNTARASQSVLRNASTHKKMAPRCRYQKHARTYLDMGLIRREHERVAFRVNVSLVGDQPRVLFSLNLGRIGLLQAAGAAAAGATLRQARQPVNDKLVLRGSRAPCDKRTVRKEENINIADAAL